MAIFLNTDKTTNCIKEIISTCQSELIMVVPYIKISQNIFQELYEADNRNVDITLIYREDKLTRTEKEKLLSLRNLNLLHHPNIHCKCYYNGELLLVSSMNLYEYSEKNNREMSILLHREDMDDSDGERSYSDNDKVFADAIDEIREIMNGSTIEKTNGSKTNSFEIEIVKTDEELEIERCNRINQHFINKKFKPFEYRTNVWFSMCSNYFDKVDVVFEGHRIGIDINLPDDEKEELFKRWKTVYNEFEFQGFKYYLNYHTAPIYIYRDSRFDWDSIQNDYPVYYKKLKQGIDSVIEKYRKVSGK
jgi:hypothetical protein